MASHLLKVDTTTITQINEILAKSPESKEKLAESIAEVVQKLWTRVCNEKGNLILEEDCNLNVRPRKEYSKFLQDLMGEKGPYLAVKKCKSWVGISEGMYKLENCDILLPVSCFETVKEKKWENPSPILVILLTLFSLLQSGVVLLLLL